MERLPIVNTGIESKRRCRLCNESIVKECFDASKEEGLVTIQDLAKRWENLNNELCKECPYNEFQLSKQRLTGKLQ